MSGRATTIFRGAANGESELLFESRVRPRRRRTLSLHTHPPSPMPFDLDDFGVAAAGTEARPVLSWRESPETSLADWTLKIVVADSSGRRATEYHCHKTALGVGPRSLPYFERIFQGSGLAEHAVGTSEIELQASAADAIPVLLDYVYLPRHARGHDRQCCRPDVPCALLSRPGSIHGSAGLHPKGSQLQDSAHILR